LKIGNIFTMLKNGVEGWVWWCTPIIPAMQKVEVGLRVALDKYETLLEK
jgi:hypothetical protein